MTAAEHALIEAVLSVQSPPHSINMQLERMPDVIRQARARVLEERMTPDLKERAYEYHRARRMAEIGWSKLDLPREVVERWYPEFEERFAGEVGTP